MQARRSLAPADSRLLEEVDNKLSRKQEEETLRKQNQRNRRAARAPQSLTTPGWGSGGTNKH